MEFFRRTYLTESLKGMLVGAVQRLAGKGGDPVVQLQTNFGGGKTHSMLALYHLFSGGAPSELVGIDAVMQEAGATKLPTARRVVLVGNKISPGQSLHQTRWHGGAHAVGRDWPGSLAARRRSRASKPTTRRRPAPAMCCASCSMSMGRA